MPLRCWTVVVVHQMIAADSIQRGDWIAYTLPSDRSVTGVLQEDWTWAGAGSSGDHIQFMTNGLRSTASFGRRFRAYPKPEG
jgi:hypothetical protein